jgi:hypothetical protein
MASLRLVVRAVIGPRGIQVPYETIAFVNTDVDADADADAHAHADAHADADADADADAMKCSRKSPIDLTY